MRKSLTVATFVVAGAGFVGVGALNMHGSDTLFTITRDMTTSTSLPGSPLCSAATSISYLGGGSGSGENAMIAGNQAVAPMSRFLGTNICHGVNDAGLPTAADGLIVALDGLVIFGSSSQAGTSACNGTAGGDDAGACATPGVPIDQTVGLAWNTTVAGYTFQNWRDVLRVLFMGKDHNGTTDCNSSLRNSLANSWASVFESSGCTSSTCTAVRHLFRRDDASGTTDIFSQLLGFGGPSATGGAAVAAGVATAFGNSYAMGSDNFCNSAKNLAAPFNVTQPGLNQGQENSNANPIVPDDDEDGDPIRRSCAFNARSGAEFVCSTYFDPANACSSAVACPTGETCFGTQCWGNSLGLVLPAVDTNALASGQQYDVQPCTQTITVNAPLIPSGRGAVANGLCPSGDTSTTTTTCFVPADSSGNANCLATNSQLTPPLSNATSQGGSGNGPSPQAVDPRVFNKWIWNGVNIAKDNSNRPLYGGAFYRIHSQTPTLSGGSACTLADMTHQIACLAGASPCSFGYAGRGGLLEPNNVAMKVQGVPPAKACVQSLGAGPFDGGTPQEYFIARKLYLNTIAGFPGATAAEQGLAQCESDAGTMNQAVSFEDFIELPTTGPNALNGGNAICEDFNEQSLCSAGSNRIACADNSGVAGLPSAAGVTTVCGNGTKEAFEECDPGAAPGTAANTCILPDGSVTTNNCSTSCRCN